MGERVERFWDVLGGLALLLVGGGLVLGVGVMVASDFLDGGFGDDTPRPAVERESTPTSLSDYGRAMEGVVGDGYEPPEPPDQGWP